MDPMYLLPLTALGLLGRVLPGLVGVGGEIIFVPALVYAADWNIQEAVAAGLVLIVFNSLSGTLRNIRSENQINWRVTISPLRRWHRQPWTGCSRATSSVRQS